MKKNYKKTTVIILLLLLFLFSAVFVFAQRELEVTYPEVSGLKPETIETPIAEYVKYIFNFAIAFVGLIAFGVLVWSGTQCFTSAGKPDALSSAKSRIKSTFLGVLLLLFSYLILITINPQLIIFHLPGLPKIPSEELPKTPISLMTTDLLGKIKEIAEKIKGTPDEKGLSIGIKEIADKIENLTNKCTCERTQALCKCQGGNPLAQCQPIHCFAGNESNHPCPDSKDIKDNQKEIIAWKDEIFYYRNRALAEKEDLELDIIKVLDKKINWYNEQIKAAEEQRIIDYLEEEKKWLEEEKRYKEELIPKLKELADTIAKLEKPTIALSALAEECFSEVSIEKNCIPTCLVGPIYGCHNAYGGCQPDTCKGNPCPMNKIQEQVGKIKPAEINSICDEIIAIIENIKRTQEKQAQI